MSKPDHVKFATAHYCPYCELKVEAPGSLCDDCMEDERYTDHDGYRLGNGELLYTQDREWGQTVPESVLINIQMRRVG